MVAGGLSLQIKDIQSKIVMDQFLIDATVRSVGAMDTSLNNVQYNYITANNVVATPWHQNNPLKSIGYVEGFLTISEILLVCPTDSEAQKKIKLMPHLERLIFYLERFVVQANLSMGQDMALSGVLDSLGRRFLTITDVSVFPMFPAAAAMPKSMPIAFLNKDKISHYHLPG